MVLLFKCLISQIFLCDVSLHSTKCHFILAFKQSVWRSVLFFGSLYPINIIRLNTL